MNDSGAIILTGSIADVKGFPSISVYSATKAAVRSFARTWTTELKDRHIRVNTISPGHIDTPIFDTWQQGDALAKMKDDLAKNVPLGRLGNADEIAKAVCFLASDEANYVAGIELYVDGGRPPKRDRCRAGMATGPLGPVSHGLAGNSSGTGASRRRVRVAD